MMYAVKEDGTKVELNEGSNTSGYRFVCIDVMNPIDLNDDRVLKWFRESVMTKLPPEVKNES